MRRALARVIDRPAPQSELTISQAGHLIRCERRRLAVELVEQFGPQPLSTLADRMVTLQHGEQYDSGERKQIYVSLYQTHLPKLDQFGVVEFEQGENIVTEGEQFSAVASFIANANRRFDADNGDVNAHHSEHRAQCLSEAGVSA